MTKAEITQWSPGLFDWLVGQFFSKLRRHRALKTMFPVLLLDSHLASLLYTGPLTTEECLVAAPSCSILTSLRVGNLYCPSKPRRSYNSHSGHCYFTGKTEAKLSSVSIRTCECVYVCMCVCV